MDGNTALHLASANNSELAVKYLISRGAKKNNTNSKGEAPADKTSSLEIHDLLSSNQTNVPLTPFPQTPMSPIASRLSQIIFTN